MNKIDRDKIGQAKYYESNTSAKHYTCMNCKASYVGKPNEVNPMCPNCFDRAMIRTSERDTLLHFLKS